MTHSHTHLQELQGEDEGLGFGLELFQVSVSMRVVRMDLCDSAAVSLSLQGVFTHTDVPQRLRHQRVQSRVLEEKTPRNEKIQINI